MFETEFPESRLNLKFIQISTFKFFLLTTITSFLFLILDLNAPSKLDFWPINDSARILVFGLTITLVSLFIIWLDKVTLYSGKTIKILRYIMKKYWSLNADTQLSRYCLKAINEFAFYAIRNQDSHIQEELINFYSEQFALERNEWSERIKIIDADTDEITEEKKKLKLLGVEYSTELYDLFYSINLELSNTNNLFLKAIERQAISGWWLYGKGYDQVTISNRTYGVVWSILKQSIEQERVIKQYWSKAHQYFDQGLGHATPKYVEGKMEITNQEEIDQRLKEREVFLEFHYSLGGLLLYKEKYAALNYILSYSQSSPPKYALLPQSMTQIFEWYEEFRNIYKHRIEHIEIYYSFPDLDNYGVSHKTSYWICKYLIILFIRQFSLQRIYTFQDHTGMPHLPANVLELRNWFDGVNHFEKLFKRVTTENRLFEVLGYESLIREKKEVMTKYISQFEEMIKNEIDLVERTKPLSKEKVASFMTTSDKTIKNGLNSYKEIINQYNRDVVYDELKLTIEGSTTFMDKASFVDEEVPNLNYDSYLAERIVNQNIKYFFPNSFFIARTHRYLFGKELLLKAITKAVNEVDDGIILGLNISYQIKEILKKSEKNIVFLPTTNNRFKDVFFILKKNDLPVIYKREPTKELSDKYKLEPTSEGSQIYASVLDLGLEQNNELREELTTESNADNIKLQVQLIIWFLWLILWKQDRKIIQISLDTRSDEQGVRDNIEDIETL